MIARSKTLLNRKALLDAIDRHDNTLENFRAHIQDNVQPRNKPEGISKKIAERNERKAKVELGRVAKLAHRGLLANANNDREKKAFTADLLALVTSKTASHLSRKLLHELNELDDNGDLKQKEDALKKQHVREQVQELFSIAASSIFDTKEEFQDFVRETVAEFLPSVPDLPNSAPEIYKERTNRKETPLDFLLRVYEPWLNGNGLFRSHIKAWDKSLYNALYKIRHDIPDFDELLPTSQGRSVKDLEKDDAEILAKYRKRNARQVSRYRKK